VSDTPCRTPALIITLDCVIFQIISVDVSVSGVRALFISQLLQCKWNFTIIEESLDWTIFVGKGLEYIIGSNPQR
jgi:hypothetical protein